MKIKQPLLSILLSSLVIALFSGCTVSLLSGGSKDNPTRHFVLSSEIQSGKTTLPTLVFAKISIPSYLDQPQIITRDENEIYRSEKNRWGEPLSRAVARELPLRCSAFLSKTQLDPSGTRIFVALDRFDGAVTGHVEISATYALLSETLAKTDDMPMSQSFKMSVPVEAPNDYTAYVRAMNVALDALAQDIASQFSK